MTKKRRIKLKFRPQDIDLIAIKQYSPELFSSIFNIALLEYVTYGKCNRFHIPETARPVKVVDEMIMITLQHDVVEEWIMSIPPGLRSETVKSILRSAIENPAVEHCVGFDMESIRQQRNSLKKAEFKSYKAEQSKSSYDSTPANDEDDLFDADIFSFDDDSIGNI